jgi:CYTH domain-containing protein
MTVVRRFLIASSLARLVARERGSTVITEGYFPPQEGRNSRIVVEGERSALILVTEEQGTPLEERTEVPRVHAEALLDVCAGRLILERSRVALDGGREALVERMTHPGALDSLTIEFGNPEEAAAFTPPVWSGSEITRNPSFTRHMMALDGVPEVQEVPLSNPAVEVLLDLLDGEPGRERALDADAAPATTRASSLDTSVFDALRRLAASIPSTPDTLDGTSPP